MRRRGIAARGLRVLFARETTSTLRNLEASHAPSPHDHGDKLASHPRPAERRRCRVDKPGAEQGFPHDSRTNGTEPHLPQRPTRPANLSLPAKKTTRRLSRESRLRFERQGKATEILGSSPILVPARVEQKEIGLSSRVSLKRSRYAQCSSSNSDTSCTGRSSPSITMPFFSA